MNDNFALFECLISLGIFGFILFFLRARERRDDYRCDIRKLRDGLFDFAHENGGDFQCAAYRETRQFLNGLLRISNGLSPGVFLLAALFVSRKNRGKSKSESERKADILPQDVMGQKIREVHSRAILTTIDFMFLRGSLGICIRCFCVALMGVDRLLRVKQWIAERVEWTIDKMAFDLGSPHFHSRIASILRWR